LLEQKVAKTQGWRICGEKTSLGAEKDELVRHTTPDSDSVFFCSRLRLFFSSPQIRRPPKSTAQQKAAC
jgi:hypothetical protein